MLLLPGAEVAISVIAPIPTEWWLRPVSIACRVGEHSAVVWKRLSFSPFAASRSATGVLHGPPNAEDAPNPTSSIEHDQHVRRTRRAAAASVIGGYLVFGSLAS